MSMKESVGMFISTMKLGHNCETEQLLNTTGYKAVLEFGVTYKTQQAKSRNISKQNSPAS